MSNPPAIAPDLSIKQFGADEVRVAAKILNECADWLSQQGLAHWEGFYTEERITAYVEERSFYLLAYREKPIGTLCLTLKGETNIWPDDARSVYISALAVLPAFHRLGFASSLLSFAERSARSLDAMRIRLDAAKHHSELTGFYVRRGYSSIGEVGPPLRKFHYLLMERTLL